MRRDYFTCVFLSMFAVALLFVAMVPLYFTIDGILLREIGTFEKVVSVAFVSAFLLIIPILAAIYKKIWMSFAIVAYGALALIPGYLMNHLAGPLAGEEASLVAIFQAFVAKAIYAVVHAPFAGTAVVFGNGFATWSLKAFLWIPIVIYVFVQLFRFYRRSYIAEQQSFEVQAQTRVAKIGMNSEMPASKPEVLGTIISAPTSAAPVASASNLPTSSSNSKDVKPRLEK